MTLARVTVELYEVVVLTDVEREKDMQEEVGGKKEGVVAVEVVEEVGVHFKMELTPQISLITLRMNSWPHSKMTIILIMEDPLCTQSSCQTR